MATTDTSGPADTRTMRIVHEALRRDLGRTLVVLAARPAPPDAQRQAIARHVIWMMQFLRVHHTGEDAGLYPLVRSRNPGAAEVLDRMDADHQAVAPRIDEVEAAARAYLQGDGDAQRKRLTAAVEGLDAVLLPHLRREEDEAMPVVSATITAAEWRDIEQRYYVKPKSLRDLGLEGFWIMDGLGPDERELVVHLVPPIPRFILLHGFAGAYRRHLAACWGQVSDSVRRVQKRGRTEVVVQADRDAVWRVVLDVTRVGEWSHECRGAEWLDGATAAVPGARFRGRNRSGVFRWGRVCEIVSAEPCELVWRTVPTALYPDSSEWSIRVDEVDGGTRIEQTFRTLKVTKLLDVAYGTLIRAHRDRSAALVADLQRLGDVAERDLARTA